MKIELLPISKLKLLKNNPRRITKDQMEKLKASIQSDPDFLYNRPVLINCVDGIYHVYAGNQRVRAAKSLRIKEIPCIIDQDLPEEVVKKRVIIDNKTFGEFDFDILANEWDLDILVDCGFTSEEILGCLDDEEVEEEAEDKKASKEKVCPHCGEKL